MGAPRGEWEKMLRIVLIDDEPSALKGMGILLSEFPDVLIAGTYTGGEKAFAAMEKDRPDAVFVDIEMPGKTGLELAEELAGKYPEIRVVFVTAYNQYAVAAFEASAADYLLKPVMKERLEKTLARLEKSGDRKPVVLEGSQGFKIQCFRKFMVYTPSGVPLGWRTRKTEELMALLVHSRHRELSREKIIDLMWPESDEEKAGVLFHTTLYNLKKALGELGGGMELIKTSGGYMLHLHDTTCDTEELEKRLTCLGKIHDGNIGEFEGILNLYTGAYYGEDGYCWAVRKRLELQDRLTAACMDMGLYYQGKALWEKAAETFESLLRIDDMHEAAYEMLIRCLRRMGNTGRMLQIYERYRTVLAGLNLPPEPLEKLCRPFDKGREYNFTKQRMEFAGYKIKKGYVQTFGGFSVFPYNNRQEPLKMRSRKERELLAFLLHAGGEGVTKDQIYHALWSESESEDVKKLIGVNLAHIKKDLGSLGVKNTVINHKKHYSICRDELELDIDLFEEAAEEFKLKNSKEAAQKILALYNGEYLCDFEAFWAISKRIRYMEVYKSALSFIARTTPSTIFESAFERL